MGKWGNGGGKGFGFPSQTRLKDTSPKLLARGGQRSVQGHGAGILRRSRISGHVCSVTLPGNPRLQVPGPVWDLPFVGTFGCKKRAVAWWGLEDVPGIDLGLSQNCESPKWLVSFCFPFTPAKRGKIVFTGTKRSPATCEVRTRQVYKHAKLPELKITREPHKNPPLG